MMFSCTILEDEMTGLSKCDDVVVEARTANRSFNRRGRSNFGEPSWHETTAPTSVNWESTVQDEDPIHVPAVSFAGQEHATSITAIADAPTARPECFFATESLHQGSRTTKTRSPQAQPLDNTQSGIRQAVRAI
jgi:hypothetical protein